MYTYVFTIYMLLSPKQLAYTIIISHVNPNVVTEIIEQTEERFKKVTVTRGKNHKFLGMKYCTRATERWI